MKKVFLSFILSLTNALAFAGHWIPASAYDYASETNVYLKLTINGIEATKDSVVEIAAFVNDDCRAIATTPTASSKASFYQLRVRGNSSEAGKKISFKVYYHGLEYSVTPSSEVTFDESTHAGINLILDAVTGFKLTNPYMVVESLPVNKELLNDMTTMYLDNKAAAYTPQGKSKLLSTFTYTWTSNSSAFTTSGNTLKITGECVNTPLSVKVTGPDYGDGKRFSANAATSVTTSYPISFKYPSKISVNKYGTTTITLTDIVGIIFDPSHVEFKFVSIGGVPAAVTSYYKKDGKYYYNVYGNMTDESSFEVYYEGTKMKSVAGKETGILSVNSIMNLASGWNWVSLYSVDPVEMSVPLLNDDGVTYQDWVVNDIQEIRTQLDNVYNDPTYGMFGDVEIIDVAEGMHKIRTFKATSFDAGTYTDGALLSYKEIHKGYNWINNPYQLDLTLSQIASAFKNTPVAGDQIIGKDGFVEYNGTNWEGAADFLLKAGKGYIYYSKAGSQYDLTFNKNVTYVVDAKTNTSVLSVAPAGASSKPLSKVRKNQLWAYDDSKFSDNMAIVASVSGVDNIESYSIGAFVGDECRGEGKVSESGKMFISVAGKSGEKVSFKLLNKETGEITDVNETLNYSLKSGSLESPVCLSAGEEATAIVSVAEMDSESITAIHDITGRRVNTMTSGIYLVTYNQNGRNVTIKVRK